MSTTPAIEPGYPLAWPAGRPRSASRKPALFRSEGRPMTMTAARRRLNEQLAAMTRNGKSWRTTNIVLSTNIRYTASGTRDQNVSRRDPADPGVALYFDLDGRPHVLACDRWDTVQDNIAAIAAHIEALRGQERWGVADLRQAFAGHVALPPPTASARPARTWWSVLGLPGPNVSRFDVDVMYRRLAQRCHPDQPGGSTQAMAELNEARDAGRAATR